MKTFEYKDYKIVGEDGDWTLHHLRDVVSRKTKETRKEWVIVGYWCNLEHVLGKIMRMEGTGGEDLQGYVERMEACYQGLRDYLADGKD